MEQFNCNKYGLIFDSVCLVTDPVHVLWVHIANQEESYTKMIRRLEPDMPEGYNNVLVNADKIECFGTLRYDIKYLCV
jgi:hypothetical protein